MSKCRWCAKDFVKTNKNQHYCDLNHKKLALRFIMWPELPNENNLKDLS